MPEQRQHDATRQGQPIAIIGLTGRFPGARTVREFRQNVLEGVESISFFDEAELRAAGATEAELSDANYVRAAPIIGDIDMFDAALFGLNAREAQLLDPQFRVFLETCHAALQQAGVVTSDPQIRIGIYAGSRDNTYLEGNVFRNAAVKRSAGDLMTIINNHTDYLATGVAYRLNLTGPAVSMVTACSTSLVAIHSAVQAIRAGECEIALAGGVEIPVPELSGYAYADGGIFSPDGHVRPFDAKARGTVFGSGCGAVVLKRLDAALADRNPIHAVIRGTAINNDGNDKVAFSAPSKSGQVAVINAAIADAALDPATIGYVEAHGTGTLVGDPIEAGALAEALGRHTDGEAYCAIASVKANVGHLGAAAGVAGMVNAVCTVRDGVLAPAINCDQPNPRIDFVHGPFYINRRLSRWDAGDQPRRAAVSSFGIGGTNANIIIEQPPPRQAPPPPNRSAQLLALSAHSPAALDTWTNDVAGHLATGDSGVADVAYTLTVGREALPLRRFIVTTGADSLTTDLPMHTGKSSQNATYLFPGQGAQYPGMAAELYQTEPVFRTEIDACAAVLRESSGLNLRNLLFDVDADVQNETRHAQPLLFAVEYALAKTLQAMGIEPTAMAGHSIGEYVAAALAGVLTRDDALRLVARRGALMQSVESGAMLAIPLPEDLIGSYLDGSVDLAAVNAPGVCVVSGKHEDIRRLEDELALQGIACQPLHTSHAFHSRMMDPILDEFEAAVRSISLRPPRIPYVSNVSGKWITDEEATDPRYWVRHLRGSVRFSESLRLLTADGDRAFIEVGPGRTLTGYVTAHDRSAVAVAAMRHNKQRESDVVALLNAIGRIWAEGVPVDWSAFWAGEERHLVALPEYPYQRERYWIDPDPPASAAPVDGPPTQTGPYTTPLWLESPPPAAQPVDGVWLIVGEPGEPVLDRVGDLARRGGATVLFADTGPAAVDALVRRAADDRRKITVVHALTMGARPAEYDEAQYAGEWLDRGFHSALGLLQDVVRDLPGTPIELILVSSQMQDVLGDGRVEPAKSGILGLVKLAPKEMEAATCRSIDVGQDGPPEQVAAQLFAEISGGSGQQVAYRGRKRWTWSYAGIEFAAPDGVPAKLKDHGVYLITGGLGGLGLVLARQLATSVSARLVLVSRSSLPDRQTWPAVLAESPDGPLARRIRGVQHVEAVGGQVLVIAADITDENRMRSVREEILAAFGPVDGIFHLAAIPGGGMLETRTRDEAAQVFAPKVHGTYVLDRVFTPDLMVLYSSIVVLSADFGLGDYLGANAVLDAFAQARWAGGRHVVSINWPPFAEVGMAHEIDAPAFLHRSEPEAPEADGVAVEPVTHPMLLGRREVEHGWHRLEIALDPVANWVVAEHRLLGTPTMPATGAVELIRAAHAELTGGDGTEIIDLVLLEPLVAVPGTRAFLDLRLQPDGHYAATVTGSDDREYVRCRVGRAGTAVPTHENLAQLRSESEQTNLPDLATLSDIISFGPRWHGISERRQGDRLELITVDLPETFRADLDAYTLHPAMMDLCVTIGQTVLAEGSHLPLSYDRITIRGALPARVHSVIRHLDDTTGVVTSCDVAIVDDEGNELVAIERFSLMRMTEDATVPTAPGGPAVLDSRYEVRPEEGAEALRRILGAGIGPQVIWCPEGLGDRMRRTAKVNRFTLAEQMSVPSAAPATTRTLITPYVEPASEVERALAALWSETLGVERIGAEDDFFDLGGNSLFAVQLVSQITRRFSVDLSAAALFDARVIRVLAAAIEQALVDKVSALSDDQAQQALQTMGLGTDG
jgi:acyl transferase domain-containing protein/acyl carrier protein